MTSPPWPEPGFYRMRLVKDGPWVPARIWIEDGERDPETGELMSDEILRAKTGDQEADIDDIWGRLQVIPEAEYDYLLARGRWAAKHEPQSPEANPRRPIQSRDIPVSAPEGK